MSEKKQAKKSEKEAVEKQPRELSEEDLGSVRGAARATPDSGSAGRFGRTEVRGIDGTVEDEVLYGAPEIRGRVRRTE